MPIDIYEIYKYYIHTMYCSQYFIFTFPTIQVIAVQINIPLMNALIISHI